MEPRTERSATLHDATAQIPFDTGDLNAVSKQTIRRISGIPLTKLRAFARTLLEIRNGFTVGALAGIDSSRQFVAALTHCTLAALQ
jgi:hypothetical protein